MVISFILNMKRSAQRIVAAPKSATAGEAELTHIHQGKEDILEGQRPVSELENEAKNAEKIAEYNPDRYREITFKGKKYKVTEKQYKQIMKDIKDKVEEAISNNIMNLNEEEYLKFIIAYKNMQENGEFIWQQ